MVDIRHLNYLIVAFFTSGITYSCSDHMNRGAIQSMKSEIERLQEENESLRNSGAGAGLTDND